MSDVIWNENARNAVFAYDAWLDVNGEHKAHESVERFWESTDSIRPQPEQPRKTVGDAVAEHNNRWPFCRGVMRIGYSPKLEHYFAFGYKYDFCKGEYKVCTREEFEACVAAKSEPEWTHVSESGYKCRYLMNTVHGDLYENERGTKFIPGMGVHNKVKPIKPTITEKERELVAKFVARIFTKEYYDLREEFDDFINEHDITN